MQANCCIFPAPSKFKLGKAIKQILLVPNNISDFNAPVQFYHQKYLKIFSQESNQFEILTKRRSNKKSAVTTTNQTKNEISDSSNNHLKYLNQSQSVEQRKKYQISLTNYQQDHQSLPKTQNQIPCLFLQGNNTDKIILMFHGNGQDLSTSYDFAQYLRNQFDLSILLMQYRGYSIYKGSPSTQKIINDAQKVISFLNYHKFDDSDIIIFGRSIGGGIAFQLASLTEVSALILLSPFLSLKKIAEDLYGKSASCLLKQTLNNHITAEKVKCPIMLIHGLKDTLVPYQHSISILGQCKSYSRLKLAQNMTHTKFNFRNDFMIPVKQFMLDLQLIPKSR